MIWRDGTHWGAAAEIAAALGPDITPARVRDWARRSGVQRSTVRTVDDLVTWLRAQLDDDERVARAATSGPWHVDGCSVLHSGPSTSASNERWGHYIAPAVGAYDGDHPTDADAAHIARHDPARVLAEVDAKRRILDAHTTAASAEDSEYDGGVTAGLLTATRLLALAYADRPGYREGWRP